MNVSELRCTNCHAPIDPSLGNVQQCAYCGTTLVVGGATAGSVPLAGAGQVVLEDAGSNKILVIKVIREHTGLGLREAKDLCDAAPCVVAREGAPERLQRFREALAAAGARVR